MDVLARRLNFLADFLKRPAVRHSCKPQLLCDELRGSVLHIPRPVSLPGLSRFWLVGSPTRRRNCCPRRGPIPSPSAAAAPHLAQAASQSERVEWRLQPAESPNRGRVSRHASLET